MGIYEAYGKDISRGGMVVNQIAADERFERHLKHLAEAKQREDERRAAMQESAGNA